MPTYPGPYTSYDQYLASLTAPASPASNQLRLPAYIPPSQSVAPSRRSINRAAAQVKQAQRVNVAAAGARARLIFGRQRIAGQIGAVVPLSGYIQPTGYPLGSKYTGLAVQVIWGLGELAECEAVIVNGKQITHAATGTYLQTYLGTSSQTADPLLSAAITDYSDTCRGTVLGQSVSLAYSVLTTRDTTWPQVYGVLKGLKCFDPRDDSTAWTINPALILAKIIRDAGETLDEDLVGDLADYCDEDVGGQARWTLSTTLSAAQSIDQIVEDLRTYAHCWIAHGSSGLRLVPDAPTSSTFTLAASDIRPGSMQIIPAKRRDIPTVVAATYTRPDEDPANAWYDSARTEVKASGVDAGTLAWRESGLSVPGIDSYGEAYRFGVERLNWLRLCDLKGECEIYDAGLGVVAGDRGTITHPFGLTAKDIRVVQCEPLSPGRYRLVWQEYDPLKYSDATESEPTSPDTSLVDPFNIPAVTDLAPAEEVYQRQDGSYASRLRITWTSDAYPYDHIYVVTISAGGTLIWSAETRDEEYVTGAIQEGQSYTVSVRIRAAIAGLGSAATDNITAQGRQLPPSDVASVTGFEAGGVVRLAWLAAVDIDIRWYEIRRLASASVTGTAATDWAAAELIDRFDGLRAVIYDTPEGDYRFYVKALDSVGNYSDNPAYVDVTVTLDTRNFFVGEATLGYSETESAAIYALADGRYVSEHGTAISTLFPNAASTYANPFLSYDTGGVSYFMTEAWDAGAIYSGTWKIDATAISAISGSVTAYLQLSTDGSSYTGYTQSSKIATARYIRAFAFCSSGSGLLVDGDIVARLDVTALEETHSGTSSAVAAETVTLDRTYTYYKAVDVTPISGYSTYGAMVGVVDNIDLESGTLDVYVFKLDGTQVAVDFTLRFLGV